MRGKKTLRVKKSGALLVAEDLKVKSSVKAGTVVVPTQTAPRAPVGLDGLQQIRVIYYG